MSTITFETGLDVRQTVAVTGGRDPDRLALDDALAHLGQARAGFIIIP